MTQEHPITPPLELVEKWECEYHHMTYGPDLSIFISEKAAHWAADQELDACCEWLNREVGTGWGHGTKLRAARRPKPPSLKEQALEALDEEHADMRIQNYKLIRSVLESLPS